MSYNVHVYIYIYIYIYMFIAGRPVGELAALLS